MTGGEEGEEVHCSRQVLSTSSPGVEVAMVEAKQTAVETEQATEKTSGKVELATPRAVETEEEAMETE